MQKPKAGRYLLFRRPVEEGWSEVREGSIGVSEVRLERMVDPGSSVGYYNFWGFALSVRSPATFSLGATKHSSVWMYHNLLTSLLLKGTHGLFLTCFLF